MLTAGPLSPHGVVRNEDYGSTKRSVHVQRTEQNRVSEVSYFSCLLVIYCMPLLGCVRVFVHVCIESASCIMCSSLLKLIYFKTSFVQYAQHV